MLKLNAIAAPTAIAVAGVRIFSDGRNPKDGSSLAVSRRAARAARRRRDRLLKRKQRLTEALVKHGFFPENPQECKALEPLDPYALRAQGLDRALTPYEFGRVLFHLNQRRGFKSNRKTDKRDDENSVMKSAISGLRAALTREGCRTVGEWLYRRKQQGGKVRARFNAQRVLAENGKIRIEKSYDLYIDRAMVEAEFDALWQAQAGLNPAAFREQARVELKDILLFQRKLKAVDPGRCTFYPDEKRAPLALPSAQRFRIYQEVNNLRWLDDHLQGQALTRAQRDAIVQALETGARKTFPQLRVLAKLGSNVTFSVEDAKRQELKGNGTTVILSGAQHFGARWMEFDPDMQDEIVSQILAEENEPVLIAWLQARTDVTQQQAQAIANVSLPEGYGSLSLKAIRQILPVLRQTVCRYDQAVVTAGFEHHSHLGARATGAALPELPYYGRALPRHVGFGTNNADDPEEKRFGRIANPTVHIGLNQVRVLVNELIRRYGPPSQVVLELARDLKRSWKQKREIEREQAANQKRNERYRQEISRILGISADRVKRELLHKRILWEELSADPADRRCPYSGVRIGLQRLLSDEVEIDHILPFSRTLDDSLNNKTVALRQANRAKGDQTPWEAFGRQQAAGFDYAAILRRAQAMPLRKRYRFAPDGMARWLEDDDDFLARALNDTRYFSRLAKAYLELICPRDTWVLPGQLTALLRGKYGLNEPDIIGWKGRKNRNDHRHHAIDACVIGVMDRGLLQRLARANARAGQEGRDRLIADAPLPWPTYREHVKRAVSRLWISHKPDHSHEKAMHDDTAYGLLADGRVRTHKKIDGLRREVIENLTVISFRSAKAGDRHGYLPDGSARPYKGYKGNSNYCIEILRDEVSGKWRGEVISTFQAYQVIRDHGPQAGRQRLRDARQGLNGGALVMRLMINDVIRLEDGGMTRTLRVVKISGNGQIYLADIHEANVDARNRDKSDPFSYISKMAGSLQKAKARRVTITPAGRLSDPGFRA